jgi:hypothetical protein
VVNGMADKNSPLFIGADINNLILGEMTEWKKIKSFMKLRGLGG